MLRAASLVCVIVCASGATLSFSNCGSNYFPETINIDSCTVTPCRVVNGTTVNVTSTFRADFDSESVKADIYLLIYGIKEQLTVNPDPCANGSTICPVKASLTPYTYRANVVIPGHMPAVDARLIWKLIDKNGRGLVCFGVAVSIFPRKEVAEIEKRKVATPVGRFFLTN